MGEGAKPKNVGCKRQNEKGKTEVALQRLENCWDNGLDEMFANWKDTDLAFENFLADDEAMEPMREFLASRAFLLDDEDLCSALQTNQFFNSITLHGFYASCTEAR
jgi:hypothetical protein